MAKKKRASKVRKVVKRKVSRRRAVRRVNVVRKKRSSSSGIASAKKRIRDIAEKDLKEGLFRRDKATTREQHKAAQRKISKARADIRKAS